MAKNTYHIHSSKRASKQIVNKPPKPTVFRPSDYGRLGNLTGRGVKIAIIDTGLPDHADIRNVIDSVDMSESGRDKADHHGHATMVSGILTAKNPISIQGVAPDAELLFVKVADQLGTCSFNGIVAGILWAIVKQVDIILISLGSQTDYPVLHDAIMKAYGQNICIFAAAGNDNPDEVEYPACYPEVLSIGKQSAGDKGNKFEVSPQFGLKMILPNYDMYTTYLHGKYTKASGSSLTAALGAGLGALLIEKAKERGDKRITPNEIYAEFAHMSYKAPTVK